MKVLIIGSGGREHALAWKMRQSPSVSELFIAPGNGGTGEEGRNVPLAADDIPALTAFAREQRIDLVVPGPELPLTLGITDAMQAAGIPCFGPSAWCAQLEGSKTFAKEFMRQAAVPTADWGRFSDAEAARAFIREKGAPIVIKADGLAAGKGVIVARSEEEALAAVERLLIKRELGEAGASLVIEEFLAGEEVSLLAFCDGESALPLPSAQDHKAAFDGDTGPNTGGMGAYSPAPILPDDRLEEMADVTIRPILAEMRRQGHPFVGILYAGLMITENGPKVLEYNVRFGDPECQPLLMRLNGDLPALFRACLEGRLREVKLEVDPRAALGVVVAAEGYPGAYEKGMPIEGLDEADALPGCKIFQAGTQRQAGKIRASGGRVLCAAALGETLALAQKHAYDSVRCVRMPGGRYRTDIGAKGLRRLARKA